ncbi:hypothetical protein B0H19DRAFT_1374743 [Mycena capillaripes]|nr:hypothetical protein B0H19DRAFT_1374743 [Mycena capillaripes]
MEERDVAVLFRPTCRGIENLWISGSPDTCRSIFPLIEDLPLGQLSCNLTYLFGSELQIDFTHRLFSRIKHLELFDYSPSLDPTIWCNLALIPHLTQLAFNGPESNMLWLGLLRTCHSLRVFVLLGLGQMEPMINSHPDKDELVKDVRFVVMNRYKPDRDWQMGAHTGNDYWSHAEDLVSKRRSGEIDSLQYWIEKDESLDIT